MDKEKDLPKRKSTRLKGFDYSTEGAYFVTICVNDRKPILSEVIKTAVGEGLAPPEYSVKLKPCGEAVKEQLQHIENRFPRVSVEDYVRILSLGSIEKRNTMDKVTCKIITLVGNYGKVNVCAAVLEVLIVNAAYFVCCICD